MKRLILSFSTLCLSIMVPAVIVMIQSPMQTIKNHAQGICSNCLALNYNSTQTHHPCNRRATTLCLQCQKKFNNLQTLLFLSRASQGRFEEELSLVTRISFFSIPVSQGCLSPHAIQDSLLNWELLFCCCCLITQLCISHQAPLSMGFPRQQYWSGLPFPSPGDLPDPWVESASPALAGRFFTTKTPGKPTENWIYIFEFSPRGSSYTLRELTCSDHSL